MHQTAARYAGHRPGSGLMWGLLAILKRGHYPLPVPGLSSINLDQGIAMETTTLANEGVPPYKKS